MGSLLLRGLALVIVAAAAPADDRRWIAGHFTAQAGAVDVAGTEASAVYTAFRWLSPCRFTAKEIVQRSGEKAFSLVTVDLRAVTSIRYDPDASLLTFYGTGDTIALEPKRAAPFLQHFDRIRKACRVR